MVIREEIYMRQHMVHGSIISIGSIWKWICNNGCSGDTKSFWDRTPYNTPYGKIYHKKKNSLESLSHKGSEAKVKTFA